MFSCLDQTRLGFQGALRGAGVMLKRGLKRVAAVVALGVIASVAGLTNPSPAWAQNSAYPGVGRPATAKEVAAWDIDVRPDFKGLPKGSGSVAKGTEVWEAKCASCHGVFGESNEVFSPLVGGTTAADVKSGRAARLTDPAYPGRTTLMKLSTVSTLWDYINRAMPWNAPKTLTPDEVYAVTAYLLNLGGVVEDNFVLSDSTMAQAQARLPNRNGMSTQHSLWPGQSLGNAGNLGATGAASNAKRSSKPDVQAVACMKDCSTEATVASFLPDHARNAHGNLAEQNRSVGAQHGADTTKPAPVGTGAAAGAKAVAAPAVAAATAAVVAAVPPQTPAVVAPAAKPAAPAPAPAPAPATSGLDTAAALALAKKQTCTACHGIEKKVLGPGFREVSQKYASRKDAVEYLTQKIRAGGSGVWGPIAMPPQSLSAEEAKFLARWIAEGAR